MTNKELTAKIGYLETRIENALNNTTIIKTDFKTDYCPDCGNPVLIPYKIYERRLNKKQNFYCAVGHSFTYTS